MNCSLKKEIRAFNFYSYPSPCKYFINESMFPKLLHVSEVIIVYVFHTM